MSLITRRRQLLMPRSATTLPAVTLGAGQRLTLPAGDFIASAGILLNGNGAILEGAGSRQTRILIPYQSTIAGYGVRAAGSVAGSDVTTVNAANTLGSTALTVTSDASITANALYQTRQYNTDAWLQSIHATGYASTHTPGAGNFPYIRHTIIRPLSKNANVLTLEHGLRFLFNSADMAGDKASIRLITALTGIIIQGITIEMMIPGASAPNPNDYTNSQPLYDVDCLQLAYLDTPQLNDIRIINAGGQAVDFDNVYNPVVRGLYADGGYNKGSSGQGYIAIGNTYHGDFQDVEIWNLRHLAIYQSSHDNVIDRVRGNADINIHGQYAQENTVTNDQRVIRSGHSWGLVTRTPWAQDYGATDGPNNKIYNGSAVAANEIYPEVPNYAITLNGTTDWLQTTAAVFSGYNPELFSALLFWKNTTVGVLRGIFGKYSTAGAYDFSFRCASTNRFDFRVRTPTQEGLYTSGKTFTDTSVWNGALLHFDRANAVSASKVRMWWMQKGVQDTFTLDTSNSYQEPQGVMVPGSEGAVIGAQTTGGANKLTGAVFGICFFSGYLLPAADALVGGLMNRFIYTAGDATKVDPRFSYLNCSEGVLNRDHTLGSNTAPAVWTINGTPALSTSIPA